MLTRQSLQTIYQRKTQIRQKLSIPEADDILHFFQEVCILFAHFKKKVVPLRYF